MTEQDSQNEPGQESGEHREDDQGEDESFNTEIKAREDECCEHEGDGIRAEAEQPGEEKFGHAKNVVRSRATISQRQGYPRIASSSIGGASYPLPMTVLTMPQQGMTESEGLCPTCQRTVQTDASFPVVYLTRQERQALALYASGLTMYSVARRMDIQPSSAATYIKRIRKKYSAAGLPLPSKVDLHRAAKELGLIS
jgi:DNA-binding CsgD family transcriptional regulator